MKPNVGGIDRIIRFILGAVLLLVGLLAGLVGVWKWVAIVIGVMMLVTAAIRFCPAYLPFGINSCERK